MVDFRSTVETIRTGRIGAEEAIVLLVAAAIIGTGTILAGFLSGPQATSIATIWLVVLTGVYASVTYRMLRETKKSREQEIMPALEFEARETGSALINIGNGPARNLDIVLRLNPAGDRYRIKRQSLPSAGDLSIPVEPLSSLGDRRFLDVQMDGLDIDWAEHEEVADDDFWENTEYPYQELVIDGMCEDIWGNRIRIEQTYDVWDLTEGFGDATPSSMAVDSSLQLLAIELSRIRRVLEHGSSE